MVSQDVQLVVADHNDNTRSLYVSLAFPYLGSNAVDETQKALTQHILLDVVKEVFPGPEEPGENVPLVHCHRVV
jgi:hypothetical protein